MKWKQSIIGLALALCAGTGLYLLIRNHQAPSDREGDDQDTPTVISVQTGALKRMTLHQYVEGYGSVEPAPAATDLPAAAALLAPPTAGIIAKVDVAEGQHVNKGDLLMTLNSGSTTFTYAEQELARQKKLYAQHNASLKALQDAEAQLSALRVTAPLAGTVVRVNVSPGAAVDVNTVVAEVMDLQRLVVKTEIPAAQAGALKTGDPVQVLAQPEVSAALAYLSPTVDTNNGTVGAWAKLPPDSGLRPGQFVPLRIVTAVHADCLAAPEASVVTDISGRSVIALVHGDEATQVPVQTGFRENGWVEISASGLKEGDKVVTVGAYALPDKTQISIVSPPAGEVPAVSAPTPNLQ